ncbi:HNH endonuclease [bacterium]|nr:HNH endonuclease [bacterium]
MITFNDYFTKEKECIYKDEKYSVRDNGAVMRHAREGKKIRHLDGEWTFGDKNSKNGYMYIGTARVHRIVAAAFLAAVPSPSHVIDHIDTNKCNNRPENLRWVTRLENALSNPITRKRIIARCGSIENFLANPACLREGDVDQNFDWMRTVSPDEAKISKDKLERWAKEDSMPTGQGQLGEWVYKGDKVATVVDSEIEYEEVTKSLTPNVLQIDWRTPTEFPLCPATPNENPLQEYLDKLKEDVVFAKNQYGESRVLMAGFDNGRTCLFVATYASDSDAVKPYALAKIEYDRVAGVYYHESCGTFFEEDGVKKYFTIGIGQEWTDGNVFDDFC